MAYIGGAFISSVAGPLAIFFGMLDIVVGLSVYKKWVTGKLTYLLIAFQFASLAYIGYAGKGYFISGNVDAVVGKKIEQRAKIATDAHSAANTTYKTHKNAQSVAATVAEGEFNADGIKGAVYAQAKSLAEGRVDTIKEPKIRQVAGIKDLEEANIILTNYTTEMQDLVSSYATSSKTLISSDSVWAIEFRKIQASLPISDTRRVSNMGTLAAKLEAVATTRFNYKSIKIDDTQLAPADLESDGFQGYIGYLADAIILALSLIMFLMGVVVVSDPELEAMKRDQIADLLRKLIAATGLQVDNPGALTADQVAILERLASPEGKADREKLLKNKITNANVVFDFIESGLSFDDFSTYTAFKQAFPGLTMSEMKKILTCVKGKTNLIDFVLQKATLDFFKNARWAEKEAAVIEAFLSSEVLENSPELGTIVNGIFRNQKSGWESLLAIASACAAKVEEAKKAAEVTASGEEALLEEDREAPEIPTVRFVAPSPVKGITLTDVLKGFVVEPA